MTDQQHSKPTSTQPNPRHNEKPISGSTNHVRVHATHDHEHDWYNTFTLSVEVVHIPHESWSSLLDKYPLYRRAPLHTSRMCAKTSLQCCQWFPLACSVLTEVSPEVSVQITTAPSCTVWFLGESTPLPTHSQWGGSQESPLNPHHRLVCRTRFYHILNQVVPI
jgi:hypothetical protein